MSSSAARQILAAMGIDMPHADMQGPGLDTAPGPSTPVGAYKPPHHGT